CHAAKERRLPGLRRRLAEEIELPDPMHQPVRDDGRRPERFPRPVAVPRDPASHQILATLARRIAADGAEIAQPGEAVRLELRIAAGGAPRLAPGERLADRKHVLARGRITGPG